MTNERLPENWYQFLYHFFTSLLLQVVVLKIIPAVSASHVRLTEKEVASTTVAHSCCGSKFLELLHVGTLEKCEKHDEIQHSVPGFLVLFRDDPRIAAKHHIQTTTKKGADMPF